MKIALLAQEEPVYFTPFLIKIIEARANQIAVIAIAGQRGAGSHPKTILGKLKNLYALWLLLEPAGFLKHLFLRLFPGKISLQKTASQFKIPVLHTSDVNSSAFLAELRRYEPDVLINQTELLLMPPLLALPKIGTLNRHASLLPRFRGRLASFWGHAQTPPEYGVTIHFVDEAIDSGPILAQKKFSLDPALPYSKILEILFDESVPLLLNALDRIHESPLPNLWENTPVHRFPTLDQIKAYRKTLASRRKA